LTINLYLSYIATLKKVNDDMSIIGD
jgi:hypothetical protein